MNDTKSLYSDLIGQFGDGWSKADAKLMLAPFSDDAAFLPDPFARPIKGRAAIEDYWRDIAFEQAEIVFRFGEIHAVGPWFATEFRCTFRRRRTGEPVDIRGAVFCETGEGRITEMRMYWLRRAGTRAS